MQFKLSCEDKNSNCINCGKFKQPWNVIEFLRQLLCHTITTDHVKLLPRNDGYTNQFLVDSKWRCGFPFVHSYTIKAIFGNTII